MMYLCLFSRLSIWFPLVLFFTLFIISNYALSYAWIDNLSWVVVVSPFMAALFLLHRLRELKYLWMAFLTVRQIHPSLMVAFHPILILAERSDYSSTVAYYCYACASPSACNTLDCLMPSAIATLAFYSPMALASFCSASICILLNSFWACNALCYVSTLDSTVVVNCCENANSVIDNRQLPRCTELVSL